MGKEIAHGLPPRKASCLSSRQSERHKLQSKSHAYAGRKNQAHCDRMRITDDGNEIKVL